jgi:hypothetical protein
LSFKSASKNQQFFAKSLKESRAAEIVVRGLERDLVAAASTFRRSLEELLNNHTEISP